MPHTNYDITKKVKAMQKTPEMIDVIHSNQDQSIYDFHRAASQRYANTRLGTDNRTGYRPSGSPIHGLNPAPPARQSDNLAQQLHIHVHQSHPTSLWYDWWMWRMFTMDLYSRPYYQPIVVVNHTTSSSENKSQPSAAQLLLAAVLAIGAAVSTLYSLVEMARCVEQLYYAEDTFANIARLTLAVCGLLIGGIAGYAMGASVLAMPVLGAIIGGLIGASALIWGSKVLMESVHRLSDSPSALDYDPRFCLTDAEKQAIEQKGYSSFAVNEAIREVAIAYDEAHGQAWSLTFWSRENREKAVMVDALRYLKAGNLPDELEFNQKIFTLKK